MSSAGSEALHVLLVEPWFTGSHRVWAEGWRRHSRHRLHLLTQPGTHWRYRMMASAVPMAEATRSHVAQHGVPDVVVASDMVDLAGYLGMCRRELAGVPSVVFFHENQLTQPVGPNGVGGRRDRHLAWTNWRSIVAGDEVWFNSEWQRGSMEDGLLDLLALGPAEDDQTTLLEGVGERFRVRPVGCELAELLVRSAQPRPQRDGAPLLIWNHRWGHDKGLDVAVRSLRTIAGEGIKFTLAVVGEDDNDDPAAVDRLLEPLRDRVVHKGWLPEPQYRELLCRADVVLASARQENFGISVVEAVAAGCVPVVPDAMAYPETIVERELRYPPGRMTTRLREVLADLDHWRDKTAAVRTSMSRFDWSNVAPADDTALEQLVALARADSSGRQPSGKQQSGRQPSGKQQSGKQQSGKPQSGTRQSGTRQSGEQSQTGVRP